MDQIGKYEILDKIGSGGFAVVYKGYDPFIKRPVAIKVCYSRDEETRERFHREAEIAGRLEHRNITGIYDFGIHEQMPYLVEEYLSGEDLANLVRRKEPEALEEKVEYLLQIAGGLEYAHSQGVIHRDVKPSNIRVLDNGQIKIMDFGTAKMTNVESNLTQTGMTLGTVAYLSPQRLLGQDKGSAMSDIFSFGVLAYELLSFRRPFPGRSIPNLIDQVLNAAPVPISESWPNCPQELGEVIHRCLEKETAKRFPSCTHVIRELEDFRLGQTYSNIPTAESSSASITAPVSIQAMSLLERAKKQLERGKLERAAMLLEEVLEIDPSCSEAEQLLVECGASVETTAVVAAEAEAALESPESRRGRKIEEAKNSIETYIHQRELGQATAALKFATQILGDFEESQFLRERIVGTLRQDLVSLKGSGIRQARLIAEGMSALYTKNRLPIELAEDMHRWVDELDPEHPTVGEIMNELRAEERRKKEARQVELRSRKQAEAVASIEKLLEEGRPDMAEKALHFAVRLLGDFEEIAQLETRISEALRQPPEEAGDSLQAGAGR